MVCFKRHSVVIIVIPESVACILYGFSFVGCGLSVPCQATMSVSRFTPAIFFVILFKGFFFRSRNENKRNGVYLKKDRQIQVCEIS